MTRWVTRLFEIQREDYGGKRVTRLSVEVPNDYRPRVDELLQRCYAKHNGHLTFSIDLPHRPRTTGPKSQSAHLHGHCQQLCEYTGYTMDEMKSVVKAETPSWPHRIVEHRGRRIEVWASEADVSVEVESEAIEITHRIAADLGVVLKEE